MIEPAADAAQFKPEAGPQPAGSPHIRASQRGMEIPDHELLRCIGRGSPEGPGTPQADVFGLGKVLYEASTGQDRLCFPTLPAGAMKEPAHARLAELNEVFLRACAPDPRSRYQLTDCRAEADRPVQVLQCSAHQQLAPRFRQQFSL
jgi:hypothetical protein